MENPISEKDKVKCKLEKINLKIALMQGELKKLEIYINELRNKNEGK